MLMTQNNSWKCSAVISALCTAGLADDVGALCVESWSGVHPGSVTRCLSTFMFLNNNNKTFQQEGSSLHPPFRWVKRAVRCLPSALLFSELGRVPSASPDVPRATWAPWWQRGNVFTVLGSPELATGLQSHQCWVEGDHHFPCTLANTAQGVAVFTAKRHCLLMLNLSTSTPRTSAANLLSGYSAPACPAAWGFFSSDAGLCICCFELHDVLVSPSLPAVKVPLHSSLALRHTSYSSKFSIIR